MKFLHAIKPLMQIVPELATPDRKVILFLYFFLVLPGEKL